MTQVFGKNDFVAKKEGYKVFFDPEEKTRMDAFLKEHGLIQQDAATKIFKWFLAQDNEVQMLVLGLLKPSPAMHRLMLNKMMDSGGRK